ncbi:divalent cation tolerance protein CutA, partial [candidate division WOR-3 bacterium]|nr:divalent cation tolerance protein CutA [candidate division WOR-3 bacterium]MBD3363598.1 divalent cation tolerance protein CutA [candidate division WOR-3 bacterium]
MFLEVHTSFTDLDQAKKVSRQLIAERLAACVNLIPAFSLYRWEGGIAAEDEVIAVLKTTEGKYPALAEKIKALHPYEIPMIVAKKIHGGTDDY